MAENKKDSFTFSDKIKNSKPAFNPFSKRVPSKIGANGKPKKTIFERTKRDAPFFVAAAAALLMLPFLYKYSGNIEDGGMLVPPGSEDTIFDPERFGFDPSVEDPTGQIAQYTGRDSFDLIKGWGSDEEPAADDSEIVDWRVQDGLDDNWNSTPSAPARSYAPAATRAAFQRTPTKINELGSASLNLRGGGGSIGRFGGANLKAAARQDSSGGPRQGIKPVSLQPLRAADSPSRSYFGQGGAAQARASRDAMGKSNALQALADAMFDPVRAGGVRGGGLGSGAFGTPGGGAQINHTLDYKGITPWWWDMMKERSQEAWRWKYFLWRRNLVEPLVRALADLAVGFGCCLVSGTDDCSMGNFLGMKAGGGSDPTCCDITEDSFRKLHPEAGWGKDACENWAKAEYGEAKWKEMCPSGWDEGRKAGRDLGFFGVRVDCLSNGIFGSAAGKKGPAQLKDRFNCEAVDTTHNFELQTAGKASKWHTYHLVVAKNYAPFEGGRNLCDAPLINYNKQSGSGIGNNEAKRGAREIQEVQTAARSSQGDSERGMGLIKENMNDGCVVYVAEGDVFDWNNFQVQVKNLLKQMYTDKTQAEYDKAFANMRLYFIEGLALKDKLSKNSWTWRKTEHNLELSNRVEVNGVEVKGMPIARLPMTYVDFETNFILHKGNKSDRTDKYKDKERRYRDTEIGVDGSSRTALANDGKENAIRMQCAFSDFQIKAVTIEEPSTLEAVLTFNPNVYGQNSEKLKVTMEVYDTNNTKLFVRDIPQNLRTAEGDGRVAIAYHPTAEEIALMTPANADEEKQVDVRWTASFGEKESHDNTGYAKMEPPEEHPVIDDGGTEVEEPQDVTGEGSATTFAYRLMDIPSNPSDRQKLASAKLTIPATDGTMAEASDEARRRATEQAMQEVENGGNVLAGSALYTDQRITQCFPNGGDNIVVKSDQAQAFMTMVREAYNQKHSDNPIVYTRAYPSIANLADATNIAIKEGISQTIPKAAVCQLGRIVSTIGKDKTMVSSFGGYTNVNKNKYGQEYNNTFGAFATYIGWESARYPSPMATDSSYPVKRFGNGLNPRFYGYNPPLTSYEYHYGNYTQSGNMSRTFQEDLNKRSQTAGDGDIFPLKELSLVKNASWVSSKTPEADDQNRQIYWQAYSPLFKEANGCDITYGSDVMSAKEALRYLEMVCRTGLSDKPRSSKIKTRTSSRPAIRGTGGGPGSTETGHSTSIGMAK